MLLCKQRCAPAQGRATGTRAGCAIACACRGDSFTVSEQLPTAHFYDSQRLLPALRRLGQRGCAAPHSAARRARPLPQLGLVAEALRADWQILAPDLRGHGDSAWSADGLHLRLGRTHSCALAGRISRQYATVESAIARMRAFNSLLSAEQARHLTLHAVRQNADGSYSFKFDDHVRLDPPPDLSSAQQHELWSRVECPTLLSYGEKSWASNPATDGRARHFKSAEVLLFKGAGHWLHHDCRSEFVAALRRFLP